MLSADCECEYECARECGRLLVNGCVRFSVNVSGRECCEAECEGSRARVHDTVHAMAAARDTQRRSQTPCLCERVCGRVQEDPGTTRALPPQSTGLLHPDP